MTSITTQEAHRVNTFDIEPSETRRFWTLLGLGIVAVTSFVTSYIIDREEPANTEPFRVEDMAPYIQDNPSAAVVSERDNAIAGSHISFGLNQRAAEVAAQNGDVGRCEFYNQQALKAAGLLGSATREVVDCTP